MPAAFTVAIPTHDRRETALLAIASVLQQSRPAAQVIVLCDGCTDGTAEAVRELREPTVRAVELTKGPGYAYGHRNVPLDEPGADVVTWLADDDLLLPDHLEQLGRIWDDDGDGRVMACAPAVLVHEDDRMQWLTRDWSITQIRELLLHRENHLPMAAVSVRAAAARAVGGWSDDYERAADWELWKAILSRPGRVSLAPEPSVLHFRATTRQQPWFDRVAQNTGWLARLQDPEEALRVRAEMRLARGRHIGEEYAALVELYDERGRAEASLSSMTRELEQQRREAEDLRRQNEDLQARAAGAGELERARAELPKLQRELRAMSDKNRSQAQELQAIYGGPWWRLRLLLTRLGRVGRFR